MNILLLGQLEPSEREAWMAELALALPQDRVVQGMQEVAADSVEVALVANPAPGQLSGLPRLRLIQSLWAGVDRLLLDHTLPMDVPLARMVDPAMTRAMAETALWAVLSLHRGFFGYARHQRNRLWLELPQRRADELTVVVLGFGEMGRACAQRLAGSGYRVSAWSRGEGPTDRAGVIIRSGRDALPGLLAQAQVLVNLLPLTPDTRGLLNADLFASLPQGAAVVNLARGAHVVDADLLTALDSQHLSHAVLDVFPIEPLPSDHRYWCHPQVTVLPHAAALTDPHSAAAVVAANIRALKRGEPLAHRVDRQRGY